MTFNDYMKNVYDNPQAQYVGKKVLRETLTVAKKAVPRPSSLSVSIASYVEWKK